MDISDLLVNPEIPQRASSDFNRKNPLSYKFELASFGLREIAQGFCNFHRQPPLLIEDHEPDNLFFREYPDTSKWSDSEKWKLMFMSSMYGSYAVVI